MRSGNLTFAAAGPAIAFVLLALVLGAAYLVLVPPLQSPDEFGHFFRVYEVSTGACLSNPPTLVPVRLAATGTRYRGHIEERRVLSLAAIWRETDEPNDETIQVSTGYLAASIYNCVPYLPASLGLWIARRLHASALTEMYAGRFANLLAYVSLTGLAIFLLPGYRLLLAAIALMPMSLHQAASLSVDALTLAASFTLCAYILRLAFHPDQGPIRIPQLAILAVLTVLNASCRFNVFLMLLLFLVPGSKFAKRTQRAAFIGLYLLLSLGVAWAWTRWNQASFSGLEDQRQARNIDIKSNAAAISQHPVLFLSTIAGTLRKDGPELAGEFVGRFGYLCVRLPRWAILSYLTLLLALALTQAEAVSLTILSKLTLVLIVAGSLVSLFALIWVFEATRPLVEQLGRGVIVPSMQGRYFISFCLPGLLLLSNRRWRIAPKLAVVPVFLLIAAVNLSAFSGIWQTFYSPAAGDARLHQATNPEPRILGVVDLPHSGAVVKRSCNVAGWALGGDAAVAKVRIYVDGQLAGEAVLGARRPDVEAAYPDEAGSANAGFNALLNLASLKPGDHILAVKVETVRGDIGGIGGPVSIRLEQ